MRGDDLLDILSWNEQSEENIAGWIIKDRGGKLRGKREDHPPRTE